MTTVLEPKRDLNVQPVKQIGQVDAPRAETRPRFTLTSRRQTARSLCKRGRDPCCDATVRQRTSDPQSGVRHLHVSPGGRRLIYIDFSRVRELRGFTASAKEVKQVIIGEVREPLVRSVTEMRARQKTAPNAPSGPLPQPRQKRFKTAVDAPGASGLQEKLAAQGILESSSNEETR